MSAGPRETLLAVKAGVASLTDSIRGLVSRHGATIFVDVANPGSSTAAGRARRVGLIRQSPNPEHFLLIIRRSTP